MVICAQLKQESCFNPSAGSSAGAVGIAQFMPETASSLGINPLDVEDAINGQCQYMKSLMNSFGDYSLALAGYNAGGGAVEQYGGIPPYFLTAPPPALYAARASFLSPLYVFNKPLKCLTPPSIFSQGLYALITPKDFAVLGINCIKPTAPFGD